MKKSNKILFILISLLLFGGLLSGCADSKDINEKWILTAVALDKKGDEIYLYVEIANIEGGNKNEGKSTGASNKYIYVKGHGKTIPEARNNVDMQIDKRSFPSTIRTVLLTEDFAKENLVEYLYRLRADELYRKKAITVITKEVPEELFEISHAKDISVGFYIEEMLKTLKEAGESFARRTSRLLENLSETYTGILLPCIGLQDKEISLIGYSVVNGTTINGFIPVGDSKGTLFLKTDKPRFHYIVPYNDNKYTIEVSLKKPNIKPFYKNDKISFDLKFNFEAKLMYGDQKTPYNFNDVSNAEVTKILTETLKNEISDAIEQAQKVYKCDYLQFGDEFRIKFPVEFEKMDWQNEFEKASFNIDVKVTLNETWMMDYETNERK